MEEKITKEKLLSLLDFSQRSSLADKYLAWEKLDINDLPHLNPVGKIDIDQHQKGEFPTNESYWSPDYPIVLEYYPYNGCDIFTNGKSYFFIYRDFGGHAPERRCRYIRKELIKHGNA